MDVVQLIRGVKARNPLWDRKHAYYHDRMITMGLWNEVASSLGTDIDTARSKWKGLRDTFRGELRKVNKTIASGNPCTSTNWEYFDEMLFVKDQIYSNTRNLAEMLYRPPVYQPGEETNTNNVYLSDLCKTEVVEGEEEMDETQGSIEDQTSAAPPSNPRNLAQDDDDFNFLMSILPQLRSLPTTKNLYVRLKIQELLYNEIVKQDSL